MIWVIISNKQTTATLLKLPKKVIFKNLICSVNVDAKAYNSKTKLNQKRNILVIRKMPLIQFISSAHFLHPLKSSEHQRVSHVFRGKEMAQ